MKKKRKKINTLMTQCQVFVNEKKQMQSSLKETFGSLNSTLYENETLKNELQLLKNELTKPLITHITTGPNTTGTGLDIEVTEEFQQVFDAVFLDLYSWEAGQMYVALSRVRESKNIFSKKSISVGDFKICQELLRRTPWHCGKEEKRDIIRHTSGR